MELANCVNCNHIHGVRFSDENKNVSAKHNDATLIIMQQEIH